MLNGNFKNTAKYHIFPQISTKDYLKLHETIKETIVKYYNVPTDIIENIIIDCYFGNLIAYCGIDLNVFLKPPSRIIHNSDEIENYYSKKYGVVVKFVRKIEPQPDLNNDKQYCNMKDKGIKIFVKTLQGWQYYLYASTDMTFGEFKEIVRAQEKIEINTMKLDYRGMILKDHEGHFVTNNNDHLNYIVLLIRKPKQKLHT